MEVKIYRWNPETDMSPHYDTFHVEFHKEARKTVMNLLEEIGDTQDGSLSFYMHSACGQGICGRCAVKVNGKVRLAAHSSDRDGHDAGPAKEKVDETPGGRKLTDVEENLCIAKMNLDIRLGLMGLEFCMGK